MLKLNYIGEKTSYEIAFKRVNAHIVQVTGNIPVKTKGFIICREDGDDTWDYTQFKTVYRKLEDGVQFSSDGSVYVEPSETDPASEAELYVPTLEEVKVTKKQEIAATCEQVIYAGIDVELTSGKEHFSLTEKDQINLFGKQAQMAAGAKKFEYHQDGFPCRYYTLEEMQKITQTAMEFITYHTTYCNALNVWIAFSEDKEEINSIVYGCDVPEEYQSEVLKDILKMNAEE